MKVCHITTVHRWNDIRIFQKQCVSLAKAGHETHLIAPLAPEGQEQGVHMHGLRASKGRLDRGLRLTREAFELAKALDADLYQIHDPELLPTASNLKKLGKIVIYDAHENVPASIRDKDWIPFAWFRRWVAYFFESYEQKVASRLDGVISVAEPLVERFSHSRRLVLRNLPMLDRFEGNPLPAELTSAESGIVYAGGLSRIRNIHVMIQTMNELDGTELLHLFGPWESEAYREECMALPGWKYCRYWGFLDNEVVYSFMKSKGKLGLILFDPNIENHKIALPNKAFEYMAAGLPIIMSDIPYWRENFVENARFVDPNTPKEVSDAIVSVLNDESLRQTLIGQGKEKVKTLNWNADSQKLLEFYGSLTS